MILVTGISGVGKTYTIEAYVARFPEFVRVSAGELLKRAGRRTAVDDPEYAVENQRALLDLLFSQVMPPLSRIILDGHAVIESSDGRIFEVPTPVVMALRPRAVVTICDNNTDVWERRRGKRVLQDPNWTASVQTAEIERSRTWARLLRVPFNTVTSGDVEAFSAIVASSVV